MTTLDFDELHKLVDASLKTETLDGLIATVRKLLQGAYERAVLDMEEEFGYIFMYYPEMLDKAIEMPIQGLTWEQRIRSWYEGENPNQGASESVTTNEPSVPTSEPRTQRTPTEPINEPSTPTSGTTPTEPPIVVPDIEAIQRVVETEYHRMYNTGAYDTANAMQEDTGKTVYKRWVTMMDDRVRDTHMYLEGDAVPLDEAFFTFDGDSAMFPGGFILPENNINCRCTLEYTTA